MTTTIAREATARGHLTYRHLLRSNVGPSTGLHLRHGERIRREMARAKSRGRGATRKQEKTLRGFPSTFPVGTDKARRQDVSCVRAAPTSAAPDVVWTWGHSVHNVDQPMARGM